MFKRFLGALDCLTFLYCPASRGSWTPLQYGAGVHSLGFAKVLAFFTMLTVTKALVRLLS